MSAISCLRGMNVVDLTALMGVMQHDRMLLVEQPCRPRAIFHSYLDPDEIIPWSISAALTNIYGGEGRQLSAVSSEKTLKSLHSNNSMNSTRSLRSRMIVIPRDTVIRFSP